MEKKEEKKNLWQEILKDAMSKKEIEDTNIFVFGDKQSGKRTLIEQISKVIKEKRKEDNSDDTELFSSKFGIIDFSNLPAINLNEADADVVAEYGVWIFNESIIDNNFKIIFDSLFEPKDILKCVCVIVADLSERWNIIPTFKKWTNFLHEHFGNLLQKFDYDKQTELKKNIENTVKLYTEPQFDEEGKYKNEILSDEVKETKIEAPLKEGVLVDNLGIPIIFVVQKSDVLSTSDDKYDIEQESEFILKHIRRLAAEFGASVVYTSAKTNINVELIYNYICHRLFFFPLMTKPNLIDKDSYFIPCGYDSLGIIKTGDTSGDLNKIFEEEIKNKNKQENKKDENEIICEDTSDFLKSIKDGEKDSKNIDRKVNDAKTLLKQVKNRKNYNLSNVSFLFYFRILFKIILKLKNIYIVEEKLMFPLISILLILIIILI